VVLPVFKTGRSPPGGGAEFDSQALPPSAVRMAGRSCSSGRWASPFGLA